MKKLMLLSMILMLGGIVSLSYGNGEPLHDNLIRAIARKDENKAIELVQKINDPKLLSTQGKRGVTALMQAIIRKQLEVAKLLIETIQDPNLLNVQDDEGKTALMYATSTIKKDSPSYSPELSRLLIEKINDPKLLNVQSERGLTALMYATLSQQPEIVRLLIKTIKDPDLLNVQDGDDRDDNTVLMWAANTGNWEIAKALKEAGVKLAVKNKQGKTAADIAKDKGYKKLARLIAPIRLLPSPVKLLPAGALSR